MFSVISFARFKLSLYTLAGDRTESQGGTTTMPTHALVVCLALCVLCSGCLRKAGPPRFVLNVDTWVGYAPFWLAKEKGFFDAEGVDMAITTMPDVGQRKASMLTATTDGIAETVDMLVLDREETVPSIAVMEIDLSNGADGIVALDSIKSVQDLRGHKVAVQRNYASEALLNYILKQHGIGTGAVQKLDMEGGAAGAAFLSGQVDVAVTFEPWLSKARARRGAKLLVTSADVPGVIVDILSIRAQFLRQHSDVVRRVMRGWFRALDYWKQHPEAANVIMAAHYNSTPQEFATLISGLIWPSYEQNEAYFGSQANAGPIYKIAQTFVDVFMETGQIKRKPEMSSGIDANLLITLYGQN